MRTQLKYAASILPKTGTVCDRIDEVCKLKKSLAKMLAENNYRFAIVGESVSSSDINSLNTIDFVISIVSHSTQIIEQIEEDVAMQRKIAAACGIENHHCVVAGEDMMSEHALQKVYGLPIIHEED